MRVIAIANQKGGVGKTATAVNLGAALGRAGYRVVVIDVDGQAHATKWLGLRKDLSPGMYDVLSGEFHPAVEVPVSQVLRPTIAPGVLVAPASRRLTTAEHLLANEASGSLHLHYTMAGLERACDFAIIDCPPSLGMVVVNALCAAREVLIPMHAEELSVDGLQELWETILKVRLTNADLTVSGILINRLTATAVSRAQHQASLRTVFGDLVFATVIGQDVRLEEAPAYQQDIFTFAPTTRAAVQFAELAREVLDEQRAARAAHKFNTLIAGSGGRA